MIHPPPVEVKQKNERIKFREKFKAYESTFIILNPFLKLKPNGKEINLGGQHIISKAELIKITEKYTWNDFKNHFSLNNLKDISNLIYNHWESSAWASSELNSMAKNLNLSYPVPGNISELNENPILKSLQKLGYDKITCESFSSSKTVLDIENFMLENDQFETASSIKTLDDKIFIYQQSDSVTTVISSSLKNIEAIVNGASLEGFFANEQSTIFWEKPS